MTTKTDAAEKLLTAARAATPGQTYGTATQGAAIVSYCRPTRTYDVGTAAKSHATGRKGDVLPALVALLG